MDLVDTHCHPHFDALIGDADTVLARARAAGVNRVIAVGVDLDDSQRAIEVASKFDNIWASVGVHPHEAKSFDDNTKNSLEKMLISVKPSRLDLSSETAKISKSRERYMSKIVAVGEIGLDYYRLNSEKSQQINALKTQIEIGQKHGLPIIFHVRNAWSDFWQTLDAYKDIRGVVHSFTGGPKQLEAALSRGLYVALNGIITFTKDQALLESAKKVPLDRLVLETDAPFLTPAADKGKVCEPKHVRLVAEFLAELRGEQPENIASVTTKNAIELFGIK